MKAARLTLGMLGDVAQNWKKMVLDQGHKHGQRHQKMVTHLHLPFIDTNFGHYLKGNGTPKEETHQPRANIVVKTRKIKTI